MSRLNEYLEASKTRNDFIADKMHARALKGECVMCGGVGTKKDHDGLVFCDRCARSAIGDLTPIQKGVSEEFISDMSPEERQDVETKIRNILKNREKSDADVITELGIRAGDGKPYSQYIHTIKPMINKIRLEGAKGEK